MTVQKVGHVVNIKDYIVILIPVAPIGGVTGVTPRGLGLLGGPEYFLEQNFRQ